MLIFEQDNIPVYLQAVKLTSTIRSGIFILGYSMLITPAALFCGVSVVVFKRYLPQNYIGWILMTAGSGVLAVLDVDSSKAASICAPFMVGMGIGMGWTMTQFPILASLPYSNNAHAFAFFTFVRSLSQVSGYNFHSRQYMLTARLCCVDYRRRYRRFNTPKLP